MRAGTCCAQWLDATAGGLLVRVDAHGARYPLRIDPFVQQGAKLVGTGAIGEADQGLSVALSGDGNTALVGGPYDNGGVGAVWVFTRSGRRWTQQGPKLVGTGAVGGDAGQGESVALSSDGNTALVGDNGGVGAVWVFTCSGTTWTQQGSKLVGTGSNGEAGQGISVALSSNGNTALVDGGDVYGANIEGAAGCSRTRGRPGPSRAQSSSVPARTTPPTRAPAWRCRATGTPRSSAPGWPGGGVGIRHATAAGHQDHQGEDQLEASPDHVQLQGDQHGNGLSVRARQDAEGAPQEAQADVQSVQVAEDLQAAEAREVHVRGARVQRRRRRPGADEEELHDHLTHAKSERQATPARQQSAAR